MATWGAFKTEIRETLLRDVGGDRYTETMLLAGLKWAQNALCAHTALYKSASFAAPDYDMASAVAFPLPSDVYLPVYKAGLLFYVKSSDSKRNYLEYVDFAEDSDRALSQGYTLPPGDTITLLKPIGAGATLMLYYYAFYPAPADDSDVLAFPQWAEAAMGLGTAYYALMQQSNSEANISQFDARPDTGNPEQSSIRRYQEWLKKQWECELAQHQRQERHTHRQGANR